MHYFDAAFRLSAASPPILLHMSAFDYYWCRFQHEGHYYDRRYFASTVKIAAGRRDFKNTKFVLIGTILLRYTLLLASFTYVIAITASHFTCARFNEVYICHSTLPARPWLNSWHFTFSITREAFDEESFHRPVGFAISCFEIRHWRFSFIFWDGVAIIARD